MTNGQDMLAGMVNALRAAEEYVPLLEERNAKLEDALRRIGAIADCDKGVAEDACVKILAEIALLISSQKTPEDDPLKCPKCGKNEAQHQFSSWWCEECMRVFEEGTPEDQSGSQKTGDPRRQLCKGLPVSSPLHSWSDNTCWRCGLVGNAEEDHDHSLCGGTHSEKTPPTECSCCGSPIDGTHLNLCDRCWRKLRVESIERNRRC